MKYFIAYSETYTGTPRDYLMNTLIDIHPLEWQIENGEVQETGFTVYRTVLHWQKISETDYEEYKDKIE